MFAAISAVDTVVDTRCDASTAALLFAASAGTTVVAAVDAFTVAAEVPAEAAEVHEANQDDNGVDDEIGGGSTDALIGRCAP